MRFDQWRRRFGLGERLDLERLLIQRKLGRRDLGLQRGDEFELRRRLRGLELGRRLELRWLRWFQLRWRIGLERQLRIRGQLRHREQLRR
jgi:hypothetical protein